MRRGESTGSMCVLCGLIGLEFGRRVRYDVMGFGIYLFSWLRFVLVLAAIISPTDGVWVTFGS